MNQSVSFCFYNNCFCWHWGKDEEGQAPKRRKQEAIAVSQVSSGGSLNRHAGNRERGNWTDLRYFLEKKQALLMAHV